MIGLQFDILDMVNMNNVSSYSYWEIICISFAVYDKN